ncbi:unnamed protein product [Rangifer tarandus platyrhynchus]|uniref:Uncharacterized protein n=1 Tax=Rangifer tarandus platyrhynchus TaxID=3082113 RepID=A0AC59Y1U2_RANTA
MGVGRGTFCRSRRFFHTLIGSHAPRSVTGELAARRSLQRRGTPAGLPGFYVTPCLWEEGKTGTHRGEEAGGRKPERRTECAGQGREACHLQAPPPGPPPASAQVGDGLKFHSKFENKKQSVVWIDTLSPYRSYNCCCLRIKVEKLVARRLIRRRQSPPPHFGTRGHQPPKGLRPRCWSLTQSPRRVFLRVQLLL